MCSFVDTTGAAYADLPLSPSLAVDSYEFTTIGETLTKGQLTNTPLCVETMAKDNPAYNRNVVETKPHFHEWATVQPGMICLARKKRTAVFRQFIAAETAVPVIACAACLPASDEKNFYFAGVARSKSVREADDGIGELRSRFFEHGFVANVLCNMGLQVRRWTSSSQSLSVAWSRCSTPADSQFTRCA